MTFPDAVAINAWREAAAAGGLAPRARKWGAREGLPHSQRPLDLGELANPCDWSKDDVGYGVLLPDNDRPPDTKAAGVDAPQPVRDLLDARPGTVVLRWRADLGGRFIRRYFADGTHQDPTIGLSPYGIAKGALPRYVVIIGGPDVIPWSVQYALETRHAVGRLPLEDDALGNYIDAMLAGWLDADVDVRAPLMWTVSHPGDITAQMRAVIASPLERKLTDPKLPRFSHLLGVGATAAALLEKLDSSRPALLVTSSHGLAEGEAEVLRGSLGLPVDVEHNPVDLDALEASIPGGAIWYSQACCSAGGDATSHYTGLLNPGTTAFATVQAVAALGATVAPAASRLLGRANPVRAVLGHVEPTFDWTLRVAETGQGLGGYIVSALSTNLFNGQPVGYAFSDYRAGVGELHSQWAALYDKLASGQTDVREKLTRLRLSAIDRQSLVLLGDPTVMLPPLAGAT
jgi:hypothetical protein